MGNTALFSELEKLLRMESRYCTEDGVLLKNAVVEAALSMQPDLIKCLLGHDGLRRNFFTDVEDVWVFDKVRFQKFVMNKRFLPDSYTSFKNEVGLINEEGDFVASSREVVLSWPFKDCVLEGGQTKDDAKREEVLWNEILAPDDIDRLTEPKVLTGFKRYDADGEHAVDRITMDDNLIIKGNNLLALHSLKAKYAGKVKLIYIDPPYNTGSDSFGYNDSFKHSTWLTFMNNRLEVARDMLMKDGGIFCVHCDDNEASPLKVLLDEIFGRGDFVATIVVRSSTPSGLKTTHKEKTIIKTKDYIHIYKRGEIRVCPQYIPKTEWNSHFSNYLDRKNLKVYSLVDILIREGILPIGSKLKDIRMGDPKFRSFYHRHKNDIFQTQPVMPEQHKRESLKVPGIVYRYGCEGDYNYAMNGRRFSFISESINILENGDEDFGLLLCDLWTDIDFQNTQNEGGVDFPAGKKPERLLLRLLKLFTKEQDLVMDFNLGSGTTAAVAHKMNRRYIGIEQMDYIQSLAVNRLKNVILGDASGISKIVGWQGGGSFVYCELAKANQNFADEVAAAETREQLADIWRRMQETGFLSWKVDVKTIGEHAAEFGGLALNDAKRFLVECLDKNLLYVPYSEMDDKEFAIAEEDKLLNRQFYAKQ